MYVCVTERVERGKVAGSRRSSKMAKPEDLPAEGMQSGLNWSTNKVGTLRQTYLHGRRTCRGPVPGSTKCSPFGLLVYVHITLVL